MIYLAGKNLLNAFNKYKTTIRSNFLVLRKTTLCGLKNTIHRKLSAKHQFFYLNITVPLPKYFKSFQPIAIQALNGEQFTLSSA
ncbi:MAG: hypothetical protein DSY43_07060 [Gammaproteobacteria bacterium]|uniref:hypothetical protein n=1 Tax=Bathymodiolus septemdierum thioautotrophic gill symbiont TaxID=113267 RepID=UPI00082527BD|nr:hypothetical protein [Bathymodiolus septemdierum thioautotrophic gill symbiont]RUA04133.1 MAG: hypothetical protein DSY43_07060 [Gammaproteobacteria bacterium]